MSKLEDNIKNFEFLENRFKDWEATEQIFDDKKAFWCLKKPNSEFQKVCLYRDGYNMFVYGDYGQFSFDSMTWLGSVYNLHYDNEYYQMKKLNSECRKSLMEFNEEVCVNDIKNWLEERITYDFSYEYPDEVSEKIINFLDRNGYVPLEDLDEFCEENDICEAFEIVEFVNDCLENANEDDWIHFLQNSNLNDFDEDGESSLWSAGKCISQTYFVCMYALKICGEKLKEKKEDEQRIRIIQTGY